MFPAGNPEPASSKSTSRMIEPSDDYSEDLLKELIDSIGDVQVNANTQDSCDAATCSSGDICFDVSGADTATTDTVERVGDAAHASATPGSLAHTISRTCMSAGDGGTDQVATHIVQRNASSDTTVAAHAVAATTAAHSTADGFLGHTCDTKNMNIIPPSSASGAVTHVSGATTDGVSAADNAPDSLCNGALAEGWASTSILDQLVNDAGHVSP